VAETAPALKWHDSPPQVEGVLWRMSRAYLGPVLSELELKAYGPAIDGVFRWNAWPMGHGTADSLDAAKLAAEACARAWLNAAVGRFELAELDKRLDQVAEQRAHAFEHRQYIRDAELAGVQNNLREQRVALCRRLEEDPHG
jgi:hypothetical protein